MRNSAGDGPVPVPDPRFDELRHTVAELRGRLAAFDGHRGTHVARAGGHLSDDGQREWDQQESRRRRADDVCSRARSRISDLRSDQRWTEELDTILRDAQQACGDMQEAIHVATRIASGLRTDHDHRLRVVRDNAHRAGERAMVARADELIERLRSDPPDQPEAEVAAIEEAGFGSARQAAHGLLARLRDAKGLVESAAVRIAGFTPGPLPDIDELACWLERIQWVHAEGDTSGSSSGERLGLWQVRASEVGEHLFPLAEEASALLARRERLRGQWRSLGARAGALDVRERPDVDWLFAQLRDGLWTAPTDLVTAEDQTLTLGNLLGEEEE